jgi:4-amino-4-deoxy-L-arabinose transferase-like glycosyltransferase
MQKSADSSRRHTLHLARGIASGASGLVLALVVALGIPLAWIWIASQIAGTRKDLTPSLAILITVGILVSYWLALVVGSRLRGRWVSGEEQQARVRRMSWNRSFRDEPHRPGDEQTDPVERLFVIVAVLGVIAFEIWFFFFAGSPLPNQPAF